jgi:hypothetical protein
MMGRKKQRAREMKLEVLMDKRKQRVREIKLGNQIPQII